MQRVRELVDQRQEALGESMSDLARVLSAAVGRKSAWDHGAVSRFLSGRVTTLDMANALVLVLRVPRPYYVPQSGEEADMLDAVARRYVTPEQQARLRAADDAMRVLELDAIRQRQQVGSGNGTGKGRNRRVVGRR